LSEDKEEYDDDDEEGEKGGLMVTTTTTATAENNEYFKKYINDNHDDDDRDVGDEAITEILKRENELLRAEVMLLQQQNENLRTRQRRSSVSTTTNEQPPPRLLIENFEEESDMFFQLRLKVVADVNNNNDTDNNKNNDDEEDDQCIYDEQTNSWICPIEPNVSFIDALRSRATWLVGLLALQSCSGFILSNNEELLQNHPVIIYFLTMLVGAGGNAGNQASVRVIRGLALGTLTTTTISSSSSSSSSTMTTAAAIGETRNRFLLREFRMALALSLIMAIAGYVRASVFHTPAPETLAVTLALIVIVFTSVCLGAMLPLILQFVGIDPVHSSTTIQVVMDILGGKFVRYMSFIYIYMLFIYIYMYHFFSLFFLIQWFAFLQWYSLSL
jgi:cation transporter-like permease